MKEKCDLILCYLKELEKAPIGASRLAPMIAMINEENKIVEELLLDSDFKHKHNLLLFLDYGVNSLIDYKKVDINVIYDNIIYVLSVFRDLENKWEIDGVDFVKVLKKEQ